MQVPNGPLVEDAVWLYLEPKKGVEGIKDTVCFYDEKPGEEVFEDGVRQ